MHLNFTTEVKKELIKNKLENPCCQFATLSAYLRTTALIQEKNGQCFFQLMTESEFVAEYFLGIIEDTFNIQLQIIQAKIDNRNGKERLIFQSTPVQSIQILKELGIIEYEKNLPVEKKEISHYMIENDCCKKAYVIGAFLGSGSCIIPNGKNNGYHLEFVFFHTAIAHQFCQLLAKCNILAKQVQRKNSIVIYIKSREGICDFLAFIGANAALRKIDEIALIRETNNQINRWTNCKLGNMDKSITAAIQHIKAIEKIEKNIGLYSLEENLYQVAMARLGDKNASMHELATKLGITKSCLNHRMRKLMQIAKEFTV